MTGLDIKGCGAVDNLKVQRKAESASGGVLYGSLKMKLMYLAGLHYGYFID